MAGLQKFTDEKRQGWGSVNLLQFLSRIFVGKYPLKNHEVVIFEMLLVRSFVIIDPLVFIIFVTALGSVHILVLSRLYEIEEIKNVLNVILCVENLFKYGAGLHLINHDNVAIPLNKTWVIEYRCLQFLFTKLQNGTEILIQHWNNKLKSLRLIFTRLFVMSLDAMK